MLYLIILGILTVISTTIIAINRCVTDNACKTNSLIKTTIKIQIFLLNLLNLFGIGVLLTYLIFEEDFENYIRYAVTSYASSYIPIGVVITIAITIALIFYKDKANLYMKSDSDAEPSQLCDYCAFNNLKIEKHSNEEDEILNLIKENPDKIEYVKKILK